MCNNVLKEFWDCIKNYFSERVQDIQVNLRWLRWTTNRFYRNLVLLVFRYYSVIGILGIGLKGT